MSLFTTLSLRSRQKKIELLEQHANLRPGARVLDIGSEHDVCFQHLAENRNLELWSLNYTSEPLKLIVQRYPHVRTVRGDARRLPFPDQSFDLVFSNAVIEHVGDFEQQARMAREVMRVSRKWFVTTPNRWFPFEFHTRLPFVGWLPPEAMNRVAQLYSYNHLARRYTRHEADTATWLLSLRGMRRLFPTSRVVASRVTIWPETIVAMGPVAAGSTP